MEYSVKEIIRAHRNLTNIMNDMLRTTDEKMYNTLSKRFFENIENNMVLKKLLNPYLEKDVSEVITRNQIGRINFNIPSDIDIQIAFVLQVLNEFKDKEPLAIGCNLREIYRKTRSMDNLDIFNRNIVSIAFREIDLKISDLINDIPQDKEKVEEKYMTIINYGNYNSSNGQVANGNQNVQNQNFTSEELFHDIIEKINSSVHEDEKEELIKLVDELKESQNKPTFREKVANFISKTAKYSTEFIDLWNKLTNL